MSAAEKLEALEQEMSPAPWDGIPVQHADDFGVDFLPGDDQGIVALRNALPALIEVVRRAEKECGPKIRPNGKPAKGTQTIEEWAACADHPIPGVQRRIEMARALHALEEALGEM